MDQSVLREMLGVKVKGAPSATLYLPRMGEWVHGIRPLSFTQLCALCVCVCALRGGGCAWGFVGPCLGAFGFRRKRKGVEFLVWTPFCFLFL